MDTYSILLHSIEFDEIVWIKHSSEKHIVHCQFVKKIADPTLKD